jgi:hypothetical protein
MVQHKNSSRREFRYITKILQKKKGLNKWDDKIKATEKREIKTHEMAFYKKPEDEIECKCYKAIAKTNQERTNTFVSRLESDIYKIRPNIYKMLKHMNKDSISGPTEEQFLKFYTQL